MSRTALIATLFSWLLTACGGSQPSPSVVPTGTSSDDVGSPPDVRGPCKYVVGSGGCFTELEEACKVAGCDKDACIQKETDPVQVSCPEK